MPLLTHQVLTEVHLSVEGDAHYPTFAARRVARDPAGLPSRPRLGLVGAGLSGTHPVNFVGESVTSWAIFPPAKFQFPRSTGETATPHSDAICQRLGDHPVPLLLEQLVADLVGPDGGADRLADAHPVPAGGPSGRQSGGRGRSPRGTPPRGRGHGGSRRRRGGPGRWLRGGGRRGRGRWRGRPRRGRSSCGAASRRAWAPGSRGRPASHDAMTSRRPASTAGSIRCGRASQLQRPRQSRAARRTSPRSGLVVQQSQQGAGLTERVRILGCR